MYKFEEPSEIKLIILYIIENYREPIDNGQITDIFMSHDFVDYFTMQQYLNELLDTHLVDVETAANLARHLQRACSQLQIHKRKAALGNGTIRSIFQLV